MTKYYQKNSQSECYVQYCVLSKVFSELEASRSSAILQNRSVVQDAFDGADPGAPAAPLAEPLVLSGPDQVHPAPVVRVLVEEPVALGDVAGEDVVDVEAVHDAGTVVHQVHHLTAELEALVQAHVERAGLLLVTGERSQLVKHSETDPDKVRHDSFPKVKQKAS